ncbi:MULTISPECIES: cell division ATP-binding protein FtsE [Gardnerella]|uniref:cell division ATP-binding protein FtsE n=1 Tax=Gardnerella TaxID=2701 RepID=UPI0007F86752|nr:cell division ATP-binding protein FtsE [Gardnerella vaginalis]NSX25043.1 cell division ATP-binding protein FtsE [Gardnerella vaginalis]PKY96842.1 cell division ATP-binding protein FtsE [Gardnerella vaginalis]PMC49751.1 cell division ATP-binding protein FtsE [Gardnerella vaginalis]RIY20299.1 cell division ATP-binding protein FtsE [Gardnerella vaginalis]
MSLISLEHVSKIYPKGTRPALDDISLDVNRGDFVFLVGASGSGKTTLLSLLLREEEATKGEIHVAGNDLRRLVNRQVPQYRRTLGFIFQDYKLLNNKTVYQNVAFALEVIGTSRSTIKSLVPRVLETVGLTGKENNYPHELSGGEAQRVAIARAYVNHPQILLADEPTGNLDPTTSLGIMEVLDAINRTGTTIVMATHNEEIVNSMRKRVVELHAGHIVRDEREGSYDSALYFPDADVEQKSKAQQAVEGDSGVRAVADSGSDNTSFNSSSEDPKNYRFMSKRAKRAAQAKQAMDAVAQTLQNGSEDNEGIARLAQSVHSGRTGRYGEVFQPLETTMTWGRGLSIPPAPPVQKSNDAEDKNNSDFADSGDSSDSGDSLDLSENQKDKNNTENIVENDIENSGDNSVDNSGKNVGNAGENSSETGDYTESKESNENSKSEASKSENLKNEGDE